MKGIGGLLFIFGLLTTGLSRAQAPAWARSQTVEHLDVNQVIVTCDGTGLSRHLAYSEALQSCASIAALTKSNPIKVSQIVIESEVEGPKLFASVETNQRFTGLSGKVENESTIEAEASFKTYLRVRYDLSAVKSTAIETKETPTEVGSLVTPKDERSSLEIERKGIVSDSTRSLTVQLNDRCTDYLIRGKLPRSRPCGASNVIQITLKAGEDEEVIFRPASNRLLPVTFKISRQPANTESEVLDVVFPRGK